MKLMPPRSRRLLLVLAASAACGASDGHSTGPVTGPDASFDKVVISLDSGDVRGDAYVLVDAGTPSGLPAGRTLSSLADGERTQLCTWTMTLPAVQGVVVCPDGAVLPGVFSNVADCKTRVPTSATCSATVESWQACMLERTCGSTDPISCAFFGPCG